MGKNGKAILKRFYLQGIGLSTNSSVRSALPSGGPPVTVEGQGGQNQLYERSTENDVFQMKTERKTEEKSRRRSSGSDGQATRALRAENCGKVNA